MKNLSGFKIQDYKIVKKVVFKFIYFKKSIVDKNRYIMLVLIGFHYHFFPIVVVLVEQFLDVVESVLKISVFAIVVAEL